MKSTLSSVKSLILILGLASLFIPQSGWAQKVVDGSFAPAAPPASSPDNRGNLLTFKIQYIDPVTGNVTSSNVTVTVAAFNPAQETYLQAQKRKADAIAAAVNAANLPGVTAQSNAQQIGLQWDPPNRKWVPVTQQLVDIKGMAVDKKNKTAIATVKDPTREPQGGAIRLRPGQPGGGGSMYKGSMSGTGSGKSTGVDPTGAQSVISFGFYSKDGSTIDVADQVGVAGETDGEILSGLASEFNLAFSSSGLTANFDSATDTLSFDKPLNYDNQVFFISDTDTGIDFNMALSIPDAPEPGSLLLLGSGLLGVAAVLRRKVMG